MYQPHFSNHQNRSNVEYGLVKVPNIDESSFDSRIPPSGTVANYSNVQIVCRINVPVKAS